MIAVARNIISKSWIGLLISLGLIVLGLVIYNFYIVAIGFLLSYLSINHGKRIFYILEEQRIWNEKNEGKLFFIFATKKKVQDFIFANCIPADCDELILLFYDGPKIITQQGSINKYMLGNIYRNHHQMRIHRLSNGTFREIEYLGNASYEIENPEEIKKKIKETYDKYYA